MFGRAAAIYKIAHKATVSKENETRTKFTFQLLTIDLAPDPRFFLDFPIS